MRMLQQQQMVLAPVFEQGALYGQRLLVGHPPQPPDPQRQAQSSASQSRVSRMSFAFTKKRAAYAPSNAR